MDQLLRHWGDSLHRLCSDHSPLSIKIGPISTSGYSFRFINAWSKHHDFLNIVKETWDTELNDRPIKKFSAKLKLLKAKLSVWNKTIFENITQNIKLAEDELIQKEILYDNFPTKANKNTLCLAQQN